MNETARNISRTDWRLATPPSLEAINCGSLQRIADAVEVMSRSYSALVSDRDRYKKWYEDYLARCNAQDRSITALKGVITKLKSKHEGGDAMRP